MAFPWMYHVVSNFFILVITVFFREVKSRGSHNIPNDKPVLFAIAPHHNQFVDPFVVLKTATRPVSFLIAKASLRRKLVGLYANWMHSIGVERPQDITRKQDGLVMIKSESFYLLEDINVKEQLSSFPSEMRLKLFGYHTDFTPMERKGVIVINKQPFTIIEILNKTTVLVDARVKDWNAVFDTPLSFSYQSPCNYNAMYNSVADHLANNDCLGIFPEGGSHDRSELLPMKAGIAIMALHTMAKYPKCDLRIVPCGLSYFHADKFRSRAVVEYGTPIEVPSLLVDMYKTGGSQKKEAASKLLQLITSAVHNVTVTAPDYKTMQTLQVIRRMYTPRNQKLTMAQKLDLTRRLSKGFIHHLDNPKVQQLENKTHQYNMSLQYYGLKDHQVERTNISKQYAIWLFFVRSLLLVCYIILAVPFALLHLPIAHMASVVAQRKASEAAKASSVKLRGRDVLSTWKILIGLSLLTVFYIVYASMLFTGLLFWGMPFQAAFKYCGYFCLSLPFGTYASLRLGETGLDIYKSLSPLWYVIFPSVFVYRPIDKLRQVRAQLCLEVNEVIDMIAESPEFQSIHEDGQLEWEVIEKELMDPGSPRVNAVL